MPSPLDLVELPFMRTALAELALLALTGGLVGTWIVLRRQAFFAHAAGTATFPGLVAADASGVSPTLAGLAVVLGYAGGVERAGRYGRAPSEAATALVLVVDLALSAAAAVVALGATLLLGRSWTALTFDPEGTAALGLPVARAELLLLALIAATVVTAIPAVGALLVSAIFVVPAAAARLGARR